MNNAVKIPNKKSSVIRSLVVTISAGVFLTILAPLGTDYLSIAERLVYWVGLCLAGWSGGMLGDWLCNKFYADIATIGRVLAQALLASLAVLLTLFTVFQHLPITFGFTSFFYVFVISLVITAVTEGFGSKSVPTPAVDNQKPALLDRLPVELRDAEIYAISAEDHYVKVHTSNGHAMILMRFKDAVRDAAPLSGIVSHRSWWVAEKGVKSIKKKQRSADLMLKNDVQAQVSRNGLKEMRESGWLE